MLFSLLLDLEDRDELDEERDDELENDGLLDFVDCEPTDCWMERPLAHSFTVCFDLRMKFSGNLKLTLRTLPTQWVSSQLVMLMSLRLLVFSITMYSPSMQHSVMLMGPLAVRWALSFCGNFWIISPTMSFCGSEVFT